MWPWPLTNWPGNGTRHIVPSWVVFVPHMNIIHEISNKAQSVNQRMLHWNCNNYLWAFLPFYMYFTTSKEILPNNYNITLQWRHNGCDSVSNHQPHDCLLNRFFRHRSKKTSKLRVTGLCAGNSPGTSEFPHTNGQLRGKCFYLMTSSCSKEK